MNHWLAVITKPLFSGESVQVPSEQTFLSVNPPYRMLLFVCLSTICKMKKMTFEKSMVRVVNQGNRVRIRYGARNSKKHFALAKRCCCLGMFLFLQFKKKKDSYQQGALCNLQFIVGQMKEMQPPD